MVTYCYILWLCLHILKVFVYLCVPDSHYIVTHYIKLFNNIQCIELLDGIEIKVENVILIVDFVLYYSTVR